MDGAFRPGTGVPSRWQRPRLVTLLDAGSLLAGSVVLVWRFLALHAILVPAAMPSLAMLQASRAASPPAGFGWWSGLDQSWYLQAALAWSRLNLDPTMHHYPPGYPVLGGLFAGITPADPFLVPDLVCMLGAMGLVAAIAGHLLGRVPLARSVGAWVFVATSVVPDLVLRSWVVPWTTTPEAACLLLCLLGALKFMDTGRPGAAAMAGFAATAALAFRPADAAAVGAVSAAFIGVTLLAAWPGWRRAVRVGAAALAAAAIPCVPFGAAYLAVNGLHLDVYMRMSATVGFEWRLLPLQWVSIVIDPQPLFAEGVGLAQEFGWIPAGLAGMAACCIVRTGLARRRLHWAVTAAVMADLLLFLCYRDLHPEYIWTDGVYHYFKWTLPLFGLYGLLLARAVWLGPRLATRLALCATGGAVVVMLFGWRIAVTDAVLLPPGLGAAALPHGLSSMSDVLLMAATPPVMDPEAVGPQIRGTGVTYYNNFDFKLTAQPPAIMVRPLRPMLDLPSTLDVPSGRFDLTGAALLGRQTLVWGVPCWFWPERAVCRPSFLFPAPGLEPGQLVRFGRGKAGNAYGLGGLSTETPIGSWTEGGLARIAFRLPPQTRGSPLDLELTAEGYEPAGSGPRRVVAFANGREFARWRFGRLPAVMHGVIPADAVPADGNVLLDLAISNPVAPLVEGSPDTRRLGIWLQAMRVTPANPP